MSKPTLRDIAAAAGVSLTSASMILNGRSTRFNEDTVKRVRIAATKLGYTRDSAAVSLRTGAYDHLAIIMPDPGPGSSGTSYLLDNPFFSDFFAGMEMAAAAPGTLFGLSRVSTEQQMKSILTHRRPRGAVVLGKLSGNISAQLGEMNIPTVIVDSSEELPAYTVHASLVTCNCDDVAMGRMAMQHLLDCGHRRICLIFGTLSSSAVHQRRHRGALEAVAAHPDLEIQTVLLETDEVSYAATEHLSAALLAQIASGCTAVLCMADILAIGVYKSLASARVRIPEQVSLISMDGLKMLDYLPYRLTTIDQSIVRRGYAVSRYLIGEDELGTIAPTFKPGETVLSLSPAPL
jgi:LacI family transcriptional regulator